MNFRAQRAEQLLLGWWPLVYGLLVWPSRSAANVFAHARVWGLVVFLVVALLVRMAAHPEAGFAQVPALLRRQPRYVYWMFGLLGSLALSVVFSVSPNVSLFGTESLQTGALFMALLLITFWLYSSGPVPSRLGLVCLFVVMNVLTILEYLGFRPLAPVVERYITLTSSFPATTVGLRGHLAGMLVLLSLLPVYWFRDRLTDWRFWALFALGCVGLGCTSNSSSYVGMAAALVLFLWLGFLRLGRRGLRWPVLLVPVVALLCMSAYRPLGTVSQVLYAWGWVHVKADSKDLSSNVTFQTRVLLWEAAARMTLARPVVGWGPQTFNNHWYEYLSKAKGDRLFRLELGLKPGQKMARINDSAAFKDTQGRTQPRQLNYVAPHNAFLDLLYSQGVVGAAMFIGFCFSLTLFLSRRAGRAALYALLPFVAYGVYLLAWFITVPTTGLAVIVLGLLVAELRALPVRQPVARQFGAATADVSAQTQTHSTTLAQGQR